MRPATIASANGISLRTLDAVYEELGTSLEPSIIDQRLDGARRDLADARRSGATIATRAGADRLGGRRPGWPRGTSPASSSGSASSNPAWPRT